MTDEERSENPLLGPIQDSFKIKRTRATGLIPRNWLLVLLLLLDRLRGRDRPLSEDDVYTYDFSMKDSRGEAISRALLKYGLPTNLGMSREGVTVRGAPGLRVFRAIAGGGIIMHLPSDVRESLVLEAIEVIRREILLVVGQRPVALPSNVFNRSGMFVEALLEAVRNRSNGRVEQALVGAKLQLRFPNEEIAANAGFAGDRQTGREADFDVGDIRVIVSVAPKDNHFQSARDLSDEGRQVFLVVADDSVSKTTNRVKREGYAGRITVSAVTNYVTSNMMEISNERGITAHEMCMQLVAEYNRRVASDFDLSLQVVVPQS